MTTAGTIAGLLRERCAAAPAHAAVYHKTGGTWCAIAWLDYGLLVDARAQALLAAGLQDGDRVALIGRNTLDWFVNDLAIMTAGLVSVPIYETSSAEQILYILKHSGAKLLFADNASYVQRLGAMLDEAVDLQRVIVLEGVLEYDSSRIVSSAAFMAAVSSVHAAELPAVRARIAPDSLATLIYTSGTTGAPKAVMLTHRNSVAAARNVEMALAPDWGQAEKRSCCYLPLSHVAERVVSLLSPMLDGRTVYICSDLDRIMDAVREVRPTIWLGAPRTWEKMYDGFRAGRSQMSPRRQRLLDWALRTALRCESAHQSGAPVSWPSRVQHALARRLVTSKILAALGLDRTAIAITGGAPSRPEIAQFFTALGLWLQEVYGQTEGYGTTSLALRSAFRAGSCGRAFPMVEVRIAADGEILVRGDNVSPGYYQEPQQTAESFVDGWLHSGDLGRMDEDGYLWVTGRKKDIIITSGSKNISPQLIELALSEAEILNGAVVVGDGRNYLTAILDVSRTKLAGYVPAGASPERIAEAYLIEHVARVNKRFSRPEQIKRHLVVFDAFSLESGLLTNTLKLRRQAVLARFSPEIESMYGVDVGARH